MEVIEFPIELDTFGLTEIILRDRYPQKGMVCKNLVTSMLVSVVSGEIKFWNERERRHGEVLRAGNCVFVPAKIRYCWLPVSTEAVIHVASTPVWKKEQQVISPISIS